MRTEKTVASENILVWCSIETLHREVVGPRQRGERGMEAGQLWGRDGPISSLRRQVYFSLRVFARKLTYRSKQHRLRLIKKLFHG